MKAANVKKVLSIVGNVLLWIFVAFSVFVTILVFSAQNNKEGIPSIMGNSLVTIQSDSMNPTLKKGDLILDKVLTPEDMASLRKGDIITYLVDLNGDGTPELNTHRIMDVYAEGGYTYYVTKGDNKETNPINDKDPVRYHDVVAKYSGTRIPVVGGIISFLQSSIGFLVVIVIPLVLFFLYELYRFIVAMINLKGKKQISADEKDEIEKRAIEEYRRQQEEKEEDIKKRAIEEYLRQQQEQQEQKEQKDSDQ